MDKDGLSEDLIGGKHDDEKYVSIGETGSIGKSKGGRCTYDYMRTLRRLRWEMSIDWDEENIDRVICSTEALEEDLQDYSIPMVVIGGDVVSLYPNLDVDMVVERIKDEVMRTDLKFSSIDYLEATRYLALNWSEDEVRRSDLRRVLPTRRGKTGTRPGMRGVGPRGKLRGDQEQWVWRKNIVLGEDEKTKILTEVIKIVTETMFKRHYYSFGGVTYHQRGGWPNWYKGDLCSGQDYHATV